MQIKAIMRQRGIWIYRGLRWTLGIIFLYSGMTKLLAPEQFAVLIEAYGLVPDPLLMPVALLLPALEVIAGAGLMVDLRGSLGTIAALLLLFVAILGYGIFLGLDVDCGCFGPEDPEAEAFHGLRPAIVRDLIMLAAIGGLYAWRRLGRIRPKTAKQLIQQIINRRSVENAYS